MQKIVLLEIVYWFNPILQRYGVWQENMNTKCFMLGCSCKQWDVWDVGKGHGKHILGFSINALTFACSLTSANPQFHLACA